jgi:group I intron endonuclease
MVNLMGTLSPNGYNLREGGGSRGKHSEEAKQKNREAHLGENNATFGIPRSKETKQKIGDGNRGKTQSDEAKRKIGDGNRGKTRTDEMNQRNRAAQLGKTITKETKQKQREANLGENNPMWGSKRSKETKQKHSESIKGDKNHNSKRVYQYTLDGTFINSFASTGEAESHLEKNGSSIRACAREKRNTAYKFKWSYTPPFI